MKTRDRACVRRSVLGASVCALALAVVFGMSATGCRKEKKEDAFAEIEKSLPPPPKLNPDPPAVPETWEEKFDAAKMAAAEKDAANAEKFWTMVVAEAEAFPEGDPRLPMAVNEAAYYYYFAGVMDKAEALFAKLVEIRKKLDGPDGIEVSTEVLKLANLCGYMNRIEEAEGYYKESLAVVEKNPSHEKYAEYKIRGLRDYAETLKKVEGREAEAAELLKQAEALK